MIRVGILEASCKLRSKIFAGGICEVAIVAYEVARGELPRLAWGVVFIYLGAAVMFGNCHVYSI